jgi:gamma-glutamyl-gamma-aminobutyrate hydrolase PuuD
MIFGYPASYADYIGEVMPLEYLTSGVSRPIHSVKDLDGISFLVLFGGEDISTYWYKQNPVKANSSSLPTNREFFEMFLVDECFRKNIPILGICRGAQWLCCYLGGSLWQHVDNHEGQDHDIIMANGVFRTNSYHHQMMIPCGEMETLAYTECRSPTKWTEVKTGDVSNEAEIVYHPSKKVLMIQGHPEWASEDHDLFKLTNKLIKELLCSN